MRSFLLDLNSSSAESEGGPNSDSNQNPFFHKNKSSKPKQNPKSKGKEPYNYKHNALLYNTGSTNHIINQKKWFTNFDLSKKGLPVI